MSCCSPVPDPPPAPGSQPCCPSKWCDPRLNGLPTRTQLKLLGTCRDEMVQFPPNGNLGNRQAFILLDQYGNAVASEQPVVNIPLLQNILVQNGIPQKNPDGSFAEQSPPPFNALLVTDLNGMQYRIRGQHGAQQRVSWDGCKFVFVADDTQLTRDQFTYIGPTHGYCDVNELVLVNLPDGTVAMGYRAKPSMPPGTCMFWGGAKNLVPAGWIICEGQSLAKAAYPDLFTAWGYKWGGAGANFNVPDGRGKYVRGVDDGAGVDPNAASRTALYSGGATGDNVGSYGKGTDTTATLYDFGMYLMAFAGCTNPPTT